MMRTMNKWALSRFKALHVDWEEVAGIIANNPNISDRKVSRMFGITPRQVNYFRFNIMGIRRAVGRPPLRIK